jgi:hypothetical protein
LTREINLDIILLKLFINSTYYNKYKYYINNYLINNYKINNRVLFKLYRCLQLLHEEHPSCSLQDLYLRLLREYPALPVDEREVAQETLQKASESIFNEEEVSTLVQQQYDAAKASQVALKAIDVAEGRAKIGELSEILAHDHLAVEQQQEKVFYENDLLGLHASTKGSNGLRWPLTTLNKSLGSLRPGDFGFIFARPETGKTTFLAHVTTHMAEQAQRPVIWVNNEEGGNKVLLRCYQSTLGLTTDALFKNIEVNQLSFTNRVGSLLRIINDPIIRHGAIEKIIAEVKPCLVVIDQLDKVIGFDAERHDLKMKSAYQWGREMGKKYECPVIAVCQAGGSAENKKKLVMTDVDSSHTAKQGEADWIIGIGKVDGEGLENVRYLNIIKNKLVGDEDSLPDLRHGFFDVVIQPEIGRYKDRIQW